MQGCGGNCACAEKEKDTCNPPSGTVVFDKDGKCSCGKSKEECCHADEQSSDALDELCEPHNGKNVCEPEIATEEQKTAP